MRDSRIFSQTTFVFLVLLSLTAATAVAAEGLVNGWFLAGSDPAGYIIGTEEVDGNSAAYIKSNNPANNKFGTLMQSFAPDQYQGQRIRFSARVKSVDVASWAGMWMRVDANQKSVSFDNMMDRPIKGTADWQEMFIVLDVPQVCENISIGVLLHGEGHVYWDDLKFEPVSLDVPVTGGMGSNSKKGPSNLNFGD